MRLLILICIAVMAGMNACAQRISVSLKKSPFTDLLRIIEEQTIYTFVYTSEQLKQLPAVTLKGDSLNVFIFLDQYLRNTGLEYKITDNFIIISSVKNEVYTLKGKILSEQEKGIGGVTVMRVNDGISTVTDQNGLFEIKNVSAAEKLLVSGAEIEPVTVSIGSKKYIEIRVKELIKELDETIVLGYGSTTKRYNTGNVFRITSKELNNAPNGNLLAALEGRAPGLLITPTSNAPSSSYQMQIRGQHSLNPNPLINYRIPPVDQPLIIINGVPFAPQNNNINQLPSPASPGSLEIYHNPYGGISPFSIIDPASIESVEILKDAATTSIYGSRAANGILLITTKKPTGERLSIETTMTTGINLASAGPAMLSTDQYLQLRRAAFKADGLQPDLTAGSPAYAPDLLKFDSTRNTDWNRYFFHRAAAFSSLNTNVSGKSGQFQFLLGLGLRNENYLLKGNFFARQFSSVNRLSFLSKNKKLSVNTSLYYSQGWNHSIGSALLLQSIRLPPNYPDLYNAAGDLNWNYEGVELSDNPAALLQQPYVINTANTVANIQLSFLLSKKLAIKLNTGYNIFLTREKTFIPAASLDPTEKKNARNWFSDGRFSTRIIEPQIEYKAASGKIGISVLSGLTFQENKVRLLNTRISTYTNDTLLNPPGNAGQTDIRALNDAYNYKSYFNRVTLQYANRYLLHLSGKYETSSRFADASNPGIFSSVGLAWIFSEENLLKEKLRFLHFGKIRFSYGSTGNDNIGYYHYLDAWSRVASYTGNQALPGVIRDASFSWSVTKKTELGLELRLFNNRVALEVSAYLHLCSNQLISEFAASLPGRSRYISNFPATVENKGWEMLIGIHPGKKNRISWSSQLNLSIPRNRLKTFPGIEQSLYAGRYWINQPLDANKVIRFTGIDPATGIYTFDHSLTSFFSTTPRIFGGLSNNIQYKNWEAEIFFEFRIQTGINYLRQTQNYPPGFPINQPVTVLDYWSGQNSGGQFQRPTLLENSNAKQAAFFLTISDAIYSNASYLRCRNFQVNYTINKIRLKKKGINSIAIFLQLKNVFTITSIKLTDPQIQQFYSYPVSRTAAIGAIMKL